MATEFINPNNPVYISYAWIEDNNDVLEICRVMRENGIDYRRDVDGLCPYKKNIADVEKEIGDGDAVVVVISKKYMTSLHTMNEWHNILEKGDIARRVFVVVLEDAEISNYEKIQEYHEILKQQLNQIITKYDNCLKEGHKPSKLLKPVERSAYDNLGFIDDLDSLYAFCHSYNRGSKIEVHRATGFQEIIEPLKKYVKKLAEAANAKKIIADLISDNNYLRNENESLKYTNNSLSRDNQVFKQANVSLKEKNDLLNATVMFLKQRNIDLQERVTELESASKTYTSFPSSKYGNVIDLGLPSGTLWADRNIGASSPEDSGYYFAWGEIEPKNGKYTWDIYKYKDNPETLPSSHDAATQNWDSDWRMPTKEQFDELIENCKWTWKKGKGYEVKGKNGNSIFLPAAGAKWPTLERVGQGGYNWSSSHHDSDLAWSLYFSSDRRDTCYTAYRYCGFPVRAVWCKK